MRKPNQTKVDVPIHATGAIRALNKIVDAIFMACENGAESSATFHQVFEDDKILSFNGVLAIHDHYSFGQVDKLQLFQNVIRNFGYRGDLWSTREGIVAALSTFDEAISGKSSTRKRDFNGFVEQIHGAIGNHTEFEDAIQTRKLAVLVVFTLFYRHVLRLRHVSAEGRLECFLSRADIDASFVESLIFGVSTGCEGLDYALGGGGLVLGKCEAEIGESPPRNICFSGMPAAGKTSLALTVAASVAKSGGCLLYTSPSPRDRTRSRMPSSA